jgi:hypothetical protein
LRRNKELKFRYKQEVPRTPSRHDGTGSFPESREQNKPEGGVTVIGEFTFYAPTKILFGPNCVKQNKNLFTGLGKKAYIITYTIPGKHYALDDVKEILDEAGIEYMIDTAIEENPSMETVERQRRSVKPTRSIL